MITHLAFFLFLLPFLACKSVSPPSSSMAWKGNGLDPQREVLRKQLKAQGWTESCPEGKVCATLLQMNDVYEIDAVSGGTAGGLDRVSTLRQELSANPGAGPVITLLAGDFLNPSGLGTIKENGKPWVGRPMVSLLKAIGTDFVIFGNHEFDLKQEDFQARLDESVEPFDPAKSSCQPERQTSGLIELQTQGLSLPTVQDHLTWRTKEKNRDTTARGHAPQKLKESHIACPTCPRRMLALQEKKAPSSCQRAFYEGGQANPPCLQWIASNVFAASDPNIEKPFLAAGWPLPKVQLIRIQNQGLNIQVALLGLTILKNQKDYLRFSELESTAKTIVQDLKSGIAGPKPDLILGITHTNREDDVALLQSVPDLNLILGGHDHQNSFDCTQPPVRCVAKADANARSVYLHRLVIDPQDRGPGRINIRSQLVPIDDQIPKDPLIKAQIDCWFQRAEGLLKSNEPSAPSLREKVAEVQGEALDGTEATIRRRQGSNLTRLIAQGMWDKANTKGSDKPKVHLAFFNSGSIRIDDLIGPGPVTYYEIIRVLPFGGKLQLGKIRVSDMAKILRRTWQDLPDGNGAILQTHPRLSLVDRPVSQITEELIIQELLALTGLKAATDIMLVVGNDYLLKFGDDLSSEEMALFDLKVEDLPEPDLRALLLTSLQQYSSSERR